MSKVIKGSAIQTEDNGFIFTPYNTNPPENSPWTILEAIDGGTLKCTDEIVQLRISIRKGNTLAAVQNSLTNRFTRLIANINTKKLYSKTTK